MKKIIKMTKEQFKAKFLELTKFTIPFKKEYTLERYLPNGWKKDEVGNYYWEIGNSETLFTCHLDTYSEKFRRVNHVISQKDPYIISTDKTTILGGDNKLGTTILIGMIERGVPGTYYFFLGEEPILSGGVWGSKGALETRGSDYFKKFKRCIAFDRRGYGSIVVRQMGRNCCSKEFARKIADEFNIRGIEWDSESGFGYYTDTAVFMDVIPECTNISAGGFNEHSKKEWVDLNYTWKVYQAAIETDWEKMPTVRVPEVRFYKEGEVEGKSLDQESTNVIKWDNFVHEKLKKEIRKMFKLIGIRPSRDYFKAGTRHLTFSKWLEEVDFDVFIVGDKIKLNEKEVSLEELKTAVFNEFKEDIKDELEYYIDLYARKVEGAEKNIMDLYKMFGEPIGILIDQIQGDDNER